jgi:hypothetical protein
MLSYTPIEKSIWSIRVFANIIQYGFFVVGIVRVKPIQDRGKVTG